MLATELVPVPDLSRARRVLCFQPHPDDADIGVGATLYVLSRAGAQVILVTVTDGGMGTMDASLKPAEVARIREREQLKSAETLGIGEVVNLREPDGGRISEPTVRDEAITLIRKYRPDFVMAPDPWLPYEAHPDHRTVGLAVAAAALLSPYPHICPGAEPHQVQGVAFYLTAHPNTFIDVSEGWHAKFEALAAHRSQFDETTLSLLEHYLTARARAWTKEGFLTEALKVLSPTHLHINVDAVHC